MHGGAYMHPPIARRQAPLQSETLSNVAARLNAKPMSVALAWLLQRSPNILLIPGTSSVEHLRENVAGTGLQLPHEAIKKFNAIHRQKENGSRKSRPVKLISQGRSQSANVRSAVEKFLKLKTVTFANVRRPTANPANSR
jgi:diketogulonate reductase-like aldo/keto reductase